MEEKERKLEKGEDEMGRKEESWGKKIVVFYASYKGKETKG